MASMVAKRKYRDVPTGYGDPLECPDCGAVVSDTRAHDAWHKRVENHVGADGNWRHAGAPVPRRP